MSDNDDEIGMDDFITELHAIADDFGENQDDGVERTREEWLKRFIASLSEE